MARNIQYDIKAVNTLMSISRNNYVKAKWIVNDDILSLYLGCKQFAETDDNWENIRLTAKSAEIFEKANAIVYDAISSLDDLSEIDKILPYTTELMVHASILDLKPSEEQAHALIPGFDINSEKDTLANLFRMLQIKMMLANFEPIIPVERNYGDYVANFARVLVAFSPHFNNEASDLYFSDINGQIDISISDKAAFHKKEVQNIQISGDNIGLFEDCCHELRKISVNHVQEYAGPLFASLTRGVDVNSGWLKKVLEKEPAAEQLLWLFN
jgi:hypothetical protein